MEKWAVCKGLSCFHEFSHAQEIDMNDKKSVSEFEAYLRNHGYSAYKLDVYKKSNKVA